MGTLYGEERGEKVKGSDAKTLKTGSQQKLLSRGKNALLGGREDDRGGVGGKKKRLISIGKACAPSSEWGKKHALRTLSGEEGAGLTSFCFRGGI